MALSLTAAQTRASVAGLPVEATVGRGAVVPFTEYEAEAAATSGTVLAASRAFGDLAAEASGRSAVRLDRADQSVDFTLAAPANAVTVRYAVQDAAVCRDGDAVLGMFVDERRVADLLLTPCYGWFYGEYPFSNNARAGGAHHFYDHARVLLKEDLPAGTVVSLRFEPTPAAPWVVVDLADFERVEPASEPPRGALSVSDFGADASGRTPSLRAFQRAVNAGRRTGRPVWIPPGEYRLDGHLIVDDVALIGAGPWRSALRGQGVGVFARRAPRGSRDVTLSGFAVIGEVMERNDREAANAIGGAFSRSRISDLFLQHAKVGLWLDGPFDGLTVSGLRIFDQTADGLNFHGGVTNSVVENTFVRGTGDDGLAMWSHPTRNSWNAFRCNTVIAPVLANGIAIYGGENAVVSGNVVADTVTRGGGIHLGARFDATPVAGEMMLTGNIVIRSGSLDPVWRHGVGAVWLYALDRPMTDARITLSGNRLIDSTDAAYQVIGKAISGLTIEDDQVAGAGAGVLQIRAPGSATARGVVATGLIGPSIDRHEADFDLHDGGGNAGWLSAPSEREPSSRPGQTTTAQQDPCPPSVAED